VTRLRIQHRWEHRYAQPVKYSAQVLRLTPRRDNSQHTLNWTLHAPGRRRGPTGSGSRGWAARCTSSTRIWRRVRT